MTRPGHQRLWVRTAFGPVLLEWTEFGLLRLELGESALGAVPDEAIPWTGATAGDVEFPWVADLAGRVIRHLAGTPQGFTDIPVDASDWSPFATRVRTAARAVEAGQVATYGALATQVGRSGAARAVGRAMATNPVPLVVPCHRIVGRGGLGGFSAGGADVKRRLLAIEGIAWPDGALGASEADPR